MANDSKRDERAERSAELIAAGKSPAKRQRAPAGVPATIGEEMAGPRKWLWFICPRCQRRVPRALASYGIRVGLNVPLTDLANFMTCASCGHAGALMQIPSQIGIGGALEIEPFPAELAMRGLENWVSRVTRTRCPAPSRHRLSRLSEHVPPTWRAPQ